MSDPITTPSPRPVPVQTDELQRVVEAMSLPAEARMTFTWLKRPEGWATLVAHVPNKLSKSKTAVLIAALANDLVQGS
jgi:hypothetical protein